jgi:hypothetical protein
MKWKSFRNLRLRPAKPALGNGRLQVQTRRAFVVHGSMVTSSQVYNWTHARRRRLLGKPLTTRHRYSVWRILVTIADPVERGTSRGRPILWRLRNNPD